MDMSAARTGALAIMVAAAIALGGCASRGAGDGASESASLSSAGATSTTTPTATATRESDAAALATDKLASLKDRIEATFAGTVRIGDEETPVSGTYAADGRDFHVRLTLGSPAGTSSTEQIVVGVANYTRADDGGWMRHDHQPAGPGGIVRLLAAADLRRIGAAEDGSAALQVSGVDLLLLARQLGLADRNIGTADGTLRLAVDESGTPVALELELVTTSSLDVGLAPSTWTLTYEISNVGALVSVQRPERAWRLHTDAADGYVLLYPDNWHLTDEADDGPLPYDLIGAPDGRALQVITYTDIGGSTADSWFAEAFALLQRDLGSTPGQEATTIGGLPARLFTMEVEEHGVRYFFQEAVIYGDTIAWDLDLWSPSGSETEDRALFEQLIARFTPLR